jgi:type I restriction enzyme, S subunit
MPDFSLLLEKAPPGWNDYRLGDICTRVQGNYQPNPNGTRLYLGLEHLAQGLPMLVGRGNEADVKSSKNAFQSDDVLFGKLRPYLRKCVLMQEEGVCSTDILVFRATDTVLPPYLCYLCHTDQFIGYAKATTSGVQHPRTSWNSLREFRLTLPPLDEQRRIARVLSTVQCAIEQQARLIDLTRELKSALMHKLFTEGVGKTSRVLETREVSLKQTEIGLVPESWNVVRLGELLSVTQYGLSVRGDSEGKYPILRMTNQAGGKIVSNNLQYVNISASEADKFRVACGDILFNRTNSFELVGRTAIFDLQGDFVFASYLIRMRTIAERLNPFFLNWYFNWNKTQARLKSIATRAVSQSNISATRLRTFVIPLPTIQEQTEIVSQLNTIDQKIEVHLQKKTLLEELFRALLHQLMTAQIRVNEVADL